MEKTDSLSERIIIACEKHIGALHPNIGPSWFEALESEFDKVLNVLKNLTLTHN